MTDKEGNVIYVGKATSLKERVRSYFSSDVDVKTAKLMETVANIEYEETDSPLEALILESKLIRKFSPKYNIREKDDKSSLYVHITKEEFPRIEVLRETDIHEIKQSRPILYGPFRSSKSLSDSLELIRKIVPFRTCRVMPKKKCLYGYIGLCEAPCQQSISADEYKQRIKQIKSFFEGRKKSVLVWLTKQLKDASKQMRYEEAAKFRDRIRSLEHLERVFLIRKELPSTVFRRIEGYDISNISGEHAVGSMVVFIEGISEKSEYRKFKIKSVAGANDVAMIEEVLTRRLARVSQGGSWEKPDLILIDGGRSQVNVAVKSLKKFNLNIPVVGLAKGPDRKKDEIITSALFPRSEVALLKEVRDEAHRFARNYYRKLHMKSLLA
jgi:excinuclease ABC subunit C